MIKYIDWGQHLRLGNYLFLYAGINIIIYKSGNELVLPDYYAWKYLVNPPKIDNDRSYDEIFHLFKDDNIEKTMDNYVKYFIENKDRVININLGSHLQSEQYFLDNIDYIKTKLLIKQDEIDKVRNKYGNFFNKPTIGIGIRLGDFINHGVFYQIPFDWYTKALATEFPNYNDYNVIVFSDDIEHAKKIFKDWNFLYAEPNGTHTHKDNFVHYHKDPMEQFILASQMDNFIGGSSTFSWWNCWMVKNFNNGKVVHSGKNLSIAGEKEHGTNKDYYPESWTLFNV